MTSKRRTGDFGAYQAGESDPEHVPGDLIARRLRRVHQRVAETAERHSPTALGEIAIHYDRGGRSEKAYDYALLASARAATRCAHSEAVRFLEMADRNSTTPAQLAEVKRRLTFVAESAGEYADALHACERALAWYAAEGEIEASLHMRAVRERLRMCLGQPARQTLGAAILMDEEARRLGLVRERVYLLVLISQAHGRLGDREQAQRAAMEAVALAEPLGDAQLMADSLNRHGVTVQDDFPSEAAELYRHALTLYRQAADRRGESRCNNNLGIVHTRLGEWERAVDVFRTAMVVSSAAGLADLQGLATLNLGVVHLKRGEHEPARHLFAEALALFSSTRNRERQLYAVYNLAHLERDAGELDTAGELYDVSASLAHEVGQAEVEIGAIAGRGLVMFANGLLDKAAASLERIRKRLDDIDGWFQGRELAAALEVRVLTARDQAELAVSVARSTVERARNLDAYGAAWLAIDAASALRDSDAAAARGLLQTGRSLANEISAASLLLRAGSLDSAWSGEAGNSVRRPRMTEAD